ncbi:MAG TPA: SMP-30/gluconolactonase/LRE family protein [Ilumatobacter sp.]|nr:SMP-30/gluconolactonase/LRE family protein [Ilumatobacter sp.]
MSAGVPVDVLARVGCVLAEGPIWDADRAVVLWTDIYAGQVWECALDGEPRVVAEHHESIGAIALAATGELLGFTPTGLWRLDGQPALLVVNPEAEPGLRANDGKPDPAGRFVGGTMGFPRPVPGAGTLWSFDAGEVRPLLRGVTISNGLAWSADGATMYYVDTPTQQVRAFAYDVATGGLGDGRVFAEVDRADGEPDGITIDAEGGVWVALWGGAKLHRYGADGALTAVVPTPVDYPTCPVFVGPALDRMVVTSATEAYPAGWAPVGAGDVYVCEPGVAGVMADRVDLVQPGL